MMARRAKQLWKYNKITGLWSSERSVTNSTADEWLRKYQSDEPNESFKISINKPKASPKDLKSLTSKYVLLDSAGYEIKAFDTTVAKPRPAGETIEGARRTAQYLSRARSELIRVVKRGEDYSSDAGEKFYPDV